MSAAQSVESTSASAVVVEVFTPPDGRVFIRVLFIDRIARPDLFGLRSGLIQMQEGQEPPPLGEPVRIWFEPVRTRLGKVWAARLSA